MITLKHLEQLSQWAISQLPGCGDRFLAGLQESWAPFRRFLYACVEEFEPEAVLECGTCHGTTLMHMASACPGTMVIGIDRIRQPEIDHLWRYDNAYFVLGDTTDNKTARMVQAILDGRKIGLIFLDSTHDGGTPMKEFSMYSRLFADECIVAVDDLLGPEHQKVKMQKFWELLPGKKMELHYLHPVPYSHIGVIDQPGFGVSVVREYE